MKNEPNNTHIPYDTMLYDTAIDRHGPSNVRDLITLLVWSLVAFVGVNLAFHLVGPALGMREPTK